MAKVTIKIGDQEHEIDTAQYPDLTSAVVQEARPDIEAELKAQHDSATKKAVSTAKSELFGQLNQLKKMNQELEGKLASMASQHNDNSNTETPVKAETPSTTTPASTASDSDLDAKIERALSKAISPVIELIESQKAEKVQSYREQKLREFEGQLIPELVTGNSQEEIDASIEKSRQVFARYATPSAPAQPANGQPSAQAAPASPQASSPKPVDQTPGHQAPAQPTASPRTQLQFSAPEGQAVSGANPGHQTVADTYVQGQRPADPQPPASSGPEGPTSLDVRNMTMEEFKAKREELLKNPLSYS